jgi:hypothetical protein
LGQARSFALGQRRLKASRGHDWPHTDEFDFAIHRDFLITERAGLEFRWEVFNLSNTVQFGKPNSDLSSGAMGSITTLAGDPRIMQFALRLHF